MAVELTSRQRNVIIAGAVFLICFLAFWFVFREKMKELNSLKSVVRRLNEEYAGIGTIEGQYDRLRREAGPVRQRILQREKSFDLSVFVATTERLQNFTRQSQGTPRSEPYGNFEKYSSTFSYTGKSVYQIVEFLKEMEKPENVISVESLRMAPVSRNDPSRQKLDVRLVTVVPVEKK